MAYRLLVLSLLFLALSGCALLAVAAVPIAKTAKIMHEASESVGPRDNYTTVRGYRVYKYAVHPDDLFEEGERWYCFIIDPVKNHSVLRVWLEDFRYQDVVECLRAKTAQIIDSFELRGENPGNFCWIYNDDFHVGVVLNGVKNPDFQVHKKILEVPIPE